MSVWDDFEIMAGVAYPEDPFLYEALVDTEAERVLREQIRDATERLVDPTPASVRAVVHYRLSSISSAYTRALDRMMHWPSYNAMATGIRQEVEIAEQQENLQNLQQQIQEEEQMAGLQMPLPLGPEWDPEEDSEEDPEMEPEGPEEDSEEDDPWMQIDEPQEQGIVPVDIEGAQGDGEITDDGGLGSGYSSPVQWDLPQTPEYIPGPL